MSNKLDEFREKNELEVIVMLMESVKIGAMDPYAATEIVMNKLRQRDEERKEDRTIYNIVNVIVAIFLLILLYKISHQ